MVVLIDSTTLLPQPTRGARLRIGELDPLRANPAAATADAALVIDQRDGVGRRRRIIPGPLRHRPHALRASVTATGRAAAQPAPFASNRQATSHLLPVDLRLDDPEPG
jgi:hypothetical protein